MIIETTKEREFIADMDLGCRVKVYRNLHKKCWSVVSMERVKYGIVLGHAKSITLENCELRVSERGRERVLAEKRKNVHAYVVGKITSVAPVDSTYSEITYDPYKYPSFVSKGCLTPIKTSKLVVFSDTMKVFSK